MRDKKKSGPKKTAEQEALEKHVDAMMDPKRPDETEPAPESESPPEEPKITAVAAPASEPAKTAPQLSPTLRKKITVSDAAAKPLSIDKLDELTEQIAKTGAGKSKKTKKPEPPAEDDDKPVDDGPAAEDAQQDITEQSTDLDDAQTDKAVDDIVAYEGDVMLAVADSTAAEHNRKFGTVVEERKGHPVLSMLFWTLIALVAILIVALVALLFMGDSLTNKLGL